MKGVNFRGIIIFLATAVFLTVGLVIYAQQKTDPVRKNEMSCPMKDKTADKTATPEDCPMMKKNAAAKTDDQKMSEHHRMVMENGEKEMGFSQTATAHHFLMMKDGGAIEVEVNDPQDIVNREKIRAHLTEIAKMFQNGDFKTPFAVHGQIPPGVPEMELLKNEIRYLYEETEKGARVRISTADQKALSAIHRFLKFQIEDHRTGDPTSLTN